MVEVRGETIIERAGENGYNRYKVPGVTVNEVGTVFCYYEARQENEDILNGRTLFYRTSVEGGWSGRVAVVEGTAVHNLTLIGGKADDAHLFWCEDYKRCFYKRSSDGGKTWSKERELTPLFEEMKRKYNWNYFSVSNGHGLLLKNGRLLVIAWMSSGVGVHKPACLIPLYSDDNGESWRLGRILCSSDILPDPTECSIAELYDGTVLAAIRHNNSFHYKGFAVSRNGGLSFKEPYLDSLIPDPVCSAGLCSAPSPDGGSYVILTNCTFFNKVGGPAPDSRKNLTMHISDDQAKTWREHYFMEALGGYSDVVYCRSSNTLVCIYEAGWKINDCFHPEKIVLKNLQIS